MRRTGGLRRRKGRCRRPRGGKGEGGDHPASARRGSEDSARRQAREGSAPGWRKAEGVGRMDRPKNIPVKEMRMKSLPGSEIEQFIELKSSLESTPLRILLESFASESPTQKNEACTQNACWIESGRNQELCWAVLECKIRDSIIHRTKGQLRGSCEPTPTLKQVISVQFCAGSGEERPPPIFVLRTVMQLCQTASDVKSLVQRYPAVVHIERSNGDLLLHKVAMMGYDKAKSVFEFVLMQGMKSNVQGKREFGGLVTRNRSMRSPLVIMYGYCFQAFSDNSILLERWLWLTRIIRKVACMSLDIDDGVMNNFPVLHAALEIGCPPGIINRILHEEGSGILKTIDFMGRGPMQIACSHCKGHATAETIIMFLRQCPNIALEMDANGNWPLNLLLKSGIKCQGIYQDDVSLVGSILQKSPQVLDVRDIEMGMPPFMLAAVGDSWSLGVVYGLLRTAPGVIDSYQHR